MSWRELAGFRRALDESRVMLEGRRLFRGWYLESPGLFLAQCDMG